MRTVITPQAWRAKVGQMTIQEQADAILGRPETDEEIMLRLAQDRASLLGVLNTINECLVVHGSVDSDTPLHHSIEAIIYHVERP